MSFAKGPIIRFNEGQPRAPPPNQYDPKEISGNHKALGFEKYSGRKGPKSDCDEKEFRAPRTPPSTTDRARKRLGDSTRSRKTRADQGSSSSRSRSTSAKATPSSCLPIPFANRYASTEELDDANHEITDLRERLENLEREKFDVETQLQTLRGTLEDNTKKYEETLINEKAQAQEALESAAKSHIELQQLWETKRVEMEKLMKEQEELASTLQAKLNEAQAEANIAATEHKKELESVLEAKRIEEEKLVKEHSEQTSSLEGELVQLRANSATLSQEIETWKSYLIEEQTKAAEFEKKFEETRVIADASQNECESLKSQLQILEQNSTDDKKSLELRHQETLEQLDVANREIRDLREWLDNLEREKSDVAALLQTVEDSLEDKAKKYEELKNELAEAQEAFESVTKSHRESQQLWETKRVEMEKKVKEHEELASTLEAKLQEAEAEARITATDHQKELENLLEAKRIEEEKLAKEHSEQITSLEAELDQLRANSISFSHDIEMWKSYFIQEQTKAAELEKKLEEDRVNADSLQNECESLKSQLEILEQNSTADKQSLELRHQETLEQLDTANHKIGDMSEWLGNLERDKLDVETQLQTVLGTLEDNTKNFEHTLRQEKAEAQEALESLTKSHIESQQLWETKRAEMENLVKEQEELASKLQAKLNEAQVAQAEACFIVTEHQKALEDVLEAKRIEEENLAKEHSEQIASLQRELDQLHANSISFSQEIETWKSCFIQEQTKAAEFENTLKEERVNSDAMQNECESLKSQLEILEQNSTEEKNSFESLHQQTLGQLDNANHEITDLRERLGNLEREKFDVEAQLQIVRVTLEDNIKNFEDTLQNEKAEAQEALESVTKSHNELQQLWETQRVEMDNLVKEHEELTSKLQAELQEAQVEASITATELTEHKKELESVLEAKRIEEEKLVKEHSDQITSLQAELEQSRANSSALSQEIETWKSYLIEEQTKAAELEKKLEEEKVGSAARQNECESLKSQLEILEQNSTEEKKSLDLRHQETLEQLDNANHEIKNLREWLGNLEREKFEVVTQLQTVRGTLEDKTNKYEELKNEKAEAQEALESVMKSRSELQHLCETQRVEMETLVKEHEDFKSKLEAQLQEAQAEASVTVAELQRELENVLEAKSIQENLVKEHSEQITSLHGELDQLRANSISLSHEIETWKSYFTQEQSKGAELEKKLEEERVNSITTQNECKSLKSQLEILEQNSTAEKKRLESLHQQTLEQLDDNFTAQKALIIRKVEKDVTARYETSLRDYKTLQMRCRAYEERIKELEAQCKEISEKYADLMGHSNHRQKIHHVNQLKEENDALKQEIFKLRKKDMESVAALKSQARGKFDRSQAFKHPLKDIEQHFIPPSGDVRGSESRQTFVVSKNAPPKQTVLRVRDEVRSDKGLAFSIDFDDNKEN